MDAALEAWWRRTQAAMMEILYRHDPDGIGSSVGAPDDEYFDAVTDLAQRLLKVEPGGDPQVAVLAQWPHAHPRMVEELVRQWSRPPAL